MDPIEVWVSSAYTFVVEASTLGTMPSVRVLMRHTNREGEITYRGGFQVVVQKLPEIIDALTKAYQHREAAMLEDKWR